MKTTNNLLKNKKGIIILISFLALLFTFKTGAQVNEQWVKNYTNLGFGEDDMNDMTTDSDGNIYVTGASSGTNTSFDFATIKYNSAGVQQWVSRYNGALNGIDAGFSVASDNSGNVYVTGKCDNANISGNDICTIKYNSAGVEQWVKKYTSAGTADDEGNDVTVDNSGNIYVTGYVTNAAGNKDIITIRYSPAGVQQWAVQYNSGTNGEAGYTVRVDASGNVYTVGNEGGDCLLIKYNAAGTQQWLKTYHNPSNGSTFTKFMEIDAAGNIYVSGQVSNSGVGYDYILIKFNNAGTQQWVKTFNGSGSGDDLVNSMYLDASSNIYLTGSSIGAANGKDYLTVKYNSSGTEQWSKRYNDPDNMTDEAFGVTADAQGNVYVTGKSVSTGTNENVLTIKYDQTGAEQWLITYNGSSNGTDYGKCISVDNTGNVIVSGVARTSGYIDYCTIKYTPAMTGIENINGGIPKSFDLSQNYPNPFNPSTKISFSIPQSGITKITVYDMLGKEVSVLVNEYMQAGSYKTDFNASGLSSGTYFYKMESPGFNEIKKMILVK